MKSNQGKYIKDITECGPLSIKSGDVPVLIASDIEKTNDSYEVTGNQSAAYYKK